MATDSDRLTCSVAGYIQANRLTCRKTPLTNSSYDPVDLGARRVRRFLWKARVWGVQQNPLTWQVCTWLIFVCFLRCMLPVWQLGADIPAHCMHWLALQVWKSFCICSRVAAERIWLTLPNTPYESFHGIHNCNYSQVYSCLSDGALILICLFVKMYAFTVSCFWQLSFLLLAAAIGLL